MKGKTFKQKMKKSNVYIVKYVQNRMWKQLDYFEIHKLNHIFEGGKLCGEAT